MTAAAVELDGPDWSLREALGDTWRWYVSDTTTSRNNAASAEEAVRRGPGWLPARVPGSVVDDLYRAGEVPDPYRARNSRACEWVAERSWVYRRQVDLPDLGPGERAVLALDGVDPSSTVFWDGEEVGRTDGLYHRTRIPLPAPRSGGPHVLAVVVHPAPASEPQVGRTERVRLHAPRMGYGWDFCPRLRHQGIWRSCRLLVGAVDVRDVSARTELVGDDGVVHVTATLDGAPGRSVPVEALLRDGDTVVARTRRDVAAATAPSRQTLTLRVREPGLWWPNGLGPAHRYRLEVRAGDGQRLVCAVHTGFRRIEMVPNAGAPRDALPWTAVVNGRTVPLVGWNWTPADALYGAVPPGRVEHLVDLAARSGARLLRVWGGGLVETEELYDACDRAGILVWQELSQSSSGMQSAPATDPDFVVHLRAEAEQVVPRLTHHPSLLMWGGGNELDEGGVPLDDETSPALAAVHAVVERLDPGRHWVPTSPSGPRFYNRLDVLAEDPDGQHDVHGPWEHQGLVEHHTLYNSGTSLAHTEFGVEGMTNRRTLEHLVPARQRWPADRTNPVYRHLGEWWNNADLVAACFGSPAGLEDLERASQLLQASGLAYAVEADRRRWPRCTAVLPWQLNESYPNAWCTSVVDHRGDPKPAYHAVARAFLPTRVTLRTERSVWGGLPRAQAEAWVWAEDGVGPGSRVRLALRSVTGEVLAAADLPVGDGVTDPRPAGRLDADLDTARRAGAAVLVWDVTWSGADGVLLDRDVVLAAADHDLAALRHLDTASVDVRVRPGNGRDEWRVAVRHLAGPLVVGLRVTDARPFTAPGWASCDGDPRPLLPGEERTFAVRWRAAHEPPPRCVEVTSWNTGPVLLTAPGGPP